MNFRYNDRQSAIAFNNITKFYYSTLKKTTKKTQKKQICQHKAEKVEAYLGEGRHIWTSLLNWTTPISRN